MNMKKPNDPNARQQERPKGMVTTADLLAGAVLPMRLTLNVTIHPGLRNTLGDEEPECQHQRGADLESRLTKYTPAVLDWARQSNENAAMLLVDPMAAAARLGAKLSRVDARALQKHVRTVGPTEILPPGVELVAINVKVADDPKKPPRGKVQPARRKQ
ncbi:MAG TPA: hypothetical protein VNM67_22845 [Thermoanaerobaculia bacterium]|nr:hypothetical protein [Thermoanaerobaculia bacterium]